MALDYTGLLADLRHESDGLLSQLTEIAAGQWDLPTPAQRWSIKDQVSHLAYFDDVANLALTHPGEFQEEAAKLIASGMDFPDQIADRYHGMAPDALLDWFTDSRRQLLDTYAGDDPRRRVPWFGPDMSVASSATARLMETWAHGQDIYDTVGAAHPACAGLRSIAHLGVSTFGFAHTLNGRDVPGEPVRVELRSPAGDQWVWGPEDAENRVEGSAEDFVLAVTQRRHWTETALVARGPVATAWLEIAQAFAGAASHREPTVKR